MMDLNTVLLKDDGPAKDDELSRLFFKRDRYKGLIRSRIVAVELREGGRDATTAAPSSWGD